MGTTAVQRVPPPQRGWPERSRRRVTSPAVPRQEEDDRVWEGELLGDDGPLPGEDGPWLWRGAMRAYLLDGRPARRSLVDLRA